VHKFVLNRAKEFIKRLLFKLTFIKRLLFKLTFIKRLLSKLKAFALRHNISPRVFFWLWFSTLIVRYTTVALRGVDSLNSNPSVDTILVVVNRLVALIVPAYVIGFGKHIAWLKIVYVLLFIWGTIEIVGIKLIVDLFS